MKKFKNNKQTTDSWTGQQIEPGSYYEIQSIELSRWQNDSKVLTDLGSGDLILNNGSLDITIVSDAFSYLLNQKVEIISPPLPFSSKIVGGKTISIRSMGQSFAVTIGANTLNYTIPFAACKITGLEILGGELGDNADFKVAHPQAGVVGQFAFGNYIAKDFYSRVSSYESDLVAGLIVRIVYNSMSAKTIYVNYLLHEVI